MANVAFGFVGGGGAAGAAAADGGGGSGALAKSMAKVALGSGEGGAGCSTRSLPKSMARAAEVPSAPTKVAAAGAPGLRGESVAE